MTKLSEEGLTFFCPCQDCFQTSGLKLCVSLPPGNGVALSSWTICAVHPPGTPSIASVANSLAAAGGCPKPTMMYEHREKRGCSWSSKCNPGPHCTLTDAIMTVPESMIFFDSQAACPMIPCRAMQVMTINPDFPDTATAQSGPSFYFVHLNRDIGVRCTTVVVPRTAYRVLFTHRGLYLISECTGSYLSAKVSKNAAFFFRFPATRKQTIPHESSTSSHPHASTRVAVQVRSGVDAACPFKPLLLHPNSTHVARVWDAAQRDTVTVAGACIGTQWNPRTIDIGY
ncbi:hypothetical protein BDN71DRAFT_1427226 [Pleurotus eryngii]|uniref:Uncharacterized protein n=1 Tax=Pleurotus eryngii TaxID=5323 RepID=A0A9P6A7Q7_PLEER|nr:hypothetical protein BDN71DRAFT_1427226 [Pleurotus eryngii]